MKKIAGLALVLSMAATSVLAQGTPNPCVPGQALGTDGVCRAITGLSRAPGLVIAGGVGGGMAIGLLGLLLLIGLGGGDDDGGGGSSSSSSSSTLN